MPRFLVTWEIDAFDVNTPREAAEWAFENCFDKTTICNYFKVTEHDTGHAYAVDLEQPAGSERLLIPVASTSHVEDEDYTQLPAWLGV